MSDLRLAEVTSDNLNAVTAIELAPGQETFVATVERSLAEAYVHPAAWPRVVLDGADVVGFVMVHFDPDHDTERLRFYLWRLNVAAAAQGRGVGRFAVEQVVAETRRRGGRRLFLSYVVGAGGPEGFYRRLGFLPTGEIDDGETVAALDLTAPPDGGEPDRPPDGG